MSTEVSSALSNNSNTTSDQKDYYEAEGADKSVGDCIPSSQIVIGKRKIFGASAPSVESSKQDTLEMTSVKDSVNSHDKVSQNDSSKDASNHSAKVNGDVNKRLVDYDQISEGSENMEEFANGTDSLKKAIKITAAKPAILAKETSASEETEPETKETEGGASPMKRPALRRRKNSLSPVPDDQASNKRLVKSKMIDETSTDEEKTSNGNTSPRRTTDRRKKESESSDAGAKRSLRSADHQSPAKAEPKKELEKPAQKRGPKPVPETPKATTSKKVESGNATAQKASKPSTPNNATASSKATKKAHRSGAKKTGASDKLYESDDFVDEEPQLTPLTHVHVARGAFGDMKFTKAKEDESPKYVSLAKSAEKRFKKSFKSPAGATPVSSPKSVTQTNAKNAKNNPTASTYPKSTPSSNRRDSIGFSSTEKLNASPKHEKVAEQLPMKKSYKKNPPVSKSSPSLFSDVEKKICDDFDAEDFLANRSKNLSDTPTASKKESTKKLVKKKKVVKMSDAEDTPGHVTEDDSESVGRKRAHSGSPHRSISRSPAMSPVSVTKKKRIVDKLTPLPKNPKLKKLTPDVQLESDLSSQNGHHMKDGCRILCRWPDKCFYPGNIIADLGFGRYKVRYLDQAYRDLPAPDIVPIAALKSGNILMIKQTDSMGYDDILSEVKIVGLPSVTNSQEWFEGIFEVEDVVTKAKEKVSWHKFIIDADQTKDYISRLDNKAAHEVVEDNISDSRVRRNRGKRPQPLDETEEEISLSVTPKKQKSKKSTSKSKPSKEYQYSEAQSFQGVLNEDTDEEHFPLFDGLAFVLTSANRARPKDGSESIEEERPPIPFNKKQVRQMIDEYGGKVVDDFMILSDIRSCFLVADQYYRTHKYLSALARAVPCVSHMWIHDCFQAGTLLNHKEYMLPAGQSLETSQIIEWHDKCPTLLANKRIFVYTENRPTNPGALDFVQIWAPLVKCMGAELLDALPSADNEESRVDILLTDISCPNSVLTQVTSLGAHAVSSEWLIQAIITGSHPEPNGHLKYRYDYVEKPEA